MELILIGISVALLISSVILLLTVIKMKAVIKAMESYILMSKAMGGVFPNSDDEPEEECCCDSDGCCGCSSENR